MKSGIDTLLADLQSQDPYTRMVSAESLGSMSHERAITALLDALQDPVPDVRRVVARSLAVQKDPIVIVPLLNALLDEDVHNTAAQALHAFADQKHLSCFTGALSHESPEVRRVAAELLGKIDDEHALRHLTTATGDEDWNVRKAAYQSLQCFHTESAVESLIKGLEDDRQVVRHAAAEALEQYKDPLAIPLLSGVVRSPSAFVRKTALAALGAIELPSVIPLLIQAFEDPTAEVRETASNLLKHRPEPVVIDVLIRCLKHSENEVSLLAASTLNGMAPERVAPAIANALSDPDFHHKVHGFELLNAFNYSIPVLPLIDALGDKNATIRSIAANTLRNQPPPLVIPPLIDALIADQIEDQGAAVELLGTIEHPDIIPPLIKAMHNETPIVRARAADALDNYGSPIPFHFLDGLLEHPSASHRKLVARLLGRCQNTKATEPLIGLLEDPTKTVRVEAIKALGQYKSEKVVEALSSMLLRSEYDLRLAAVTALEHMQAIHALSPLLENLKRWDSDSFSIPAILTASLYLQGERQISQALSDSLFFHLQPINIDIQTKLHLNDLQGRGGFDALRSLHEAGEWRHLAFFAKREITGLGYMILRMARLLNATFNIQKQEADHLFCSDHLTRFSRIKLNGITYLGCRICEETHRVIKTKRMVAVLDSTMELDLVPSRQEYRINWLTTKKIVDFEHVIIGPCTEEQVTEFCIAIGNDSDPYRAKRTHQLTIQIQPNIEISNELLSILKRQFKRVTYS